MFKDLFKKKKVACEEVPLVEEKEAFNLESKMSIVEDGNVTYIKVFSPIFQKELFLIDTALWHKKYIYIDDEEKCFDRIVINVDNIFYQYTIYKDGSIRLVKRVSHENGVDEISLKISYLKFSYCEMSHNIAGSTMVICSASVSDRAYEVLYFTPPLKHFCESGIVPADIFDVQKINYIINDFLNLDFKVMNDDLNKTLELKENALLLKR